MNMHGPLQHRTRSSGIHEIQNAMDHLVAADAENGCSQQSLVVGMDQNFHKPLGLALFHCPADLGHRPLGDECRLFAFPNLPFRHPRASQRGIDVECIGGHAVGDTTLIIVEKVRGDDFEINKNPFQSNMEKLKAEQQPNVQPMLGPTAVTATCVPMAAPSVSRPMIERPPTVSPARVTVTAAS